MLNVRPKNPFGSSIQDADPLPHFAPFFPDELLRERWEAMNARRAQAGDLFAEPNIGFHHNPMESDVSYLYVASSPNYPDEVKIGMTDHRPDKRLKKAATDIAFRKDPDVEIRAFFMIKNARAKDVESTVHKLLETFRSDPVMREEGRDGTGEREWFRIDPFRAVSAVELAARCYAEPKKVRHLSKLIGSGLNDLDAIMIIEDLVPGFLERQEAVLTDDPDWNPEIAGQASETFYDLHGVSFTRMNRWKEPVREDLVLVPVCPPPERYFWDYARWLIPQREELMGADILGVYPNNVCSDFLRNLDVSVPEDQPFLRNGFAVGSINREGSVDLRFTMYNGGLGPVNHSAEALYKTDLINSPLMKRITTLYWELRDRIDTALPDFESPVLSHQTYGRNMYLHRLCADLLRTPANDLTPRVAQVLHGAAISEAATPYNMCVCPLELCEIAQPLLREHGRTPDAKLGQDGPEAT